MSADDHLRAAVVELAHALHLAGQVLDLASDHADPKYHADAYERAQLREAIETLHTWRRRHPELVQLSARVARKRPNPRAIGDAFSPEIAPAPPPAPHDPDHEAHAEPGRW